jgi:hypothetical protein
MREYASKICKGLILGATVSDKKGFLPRGVSPEDCKSHYIDTSRDQYTDWIYAAYRLYYSPLSTDSQREDIRICLLAMSEKFEAEITLENDWSFLREDGKHGIPVTKMYGDVGAHEALRLPMLYLLTWKTTGDAHIKELYLRYRNEAIEKSKEYVPLSGPSYAALQMQYSMRLIYDLDDDPNVRDSLLKIMESLAEPYEELSVKEPCSSLEEVKRLSAWLEPLLELIGESSN